MENETITDRSIIMNVTKDYKYYNKVYDLLVKVGGAPEDMRDYFTFIHVDERHSVEEYRFQGKLGFGGKYWKWRNSVTCYSEDETPERVKIMNELNERLAKLEKPDEL
jgi:hypothetical protein